MNTGKMNGAVLAILFSFLLAACDKPNTVENSGREINRAAAKAGDKMDDASKKVGEQAAKTGEVLDDAAVTTKVKTAILAEPGLRVLEINVDTKANVVTLTGAVDTQASIEKAKQVAAAVSGVTRVENRLVVKTP